MSRPNRPHWAWPVRRGPDGKLVTVEQGSDSHIRSCENVIVRCPTGWRPERPEFGWPFPTFANAPLNTDALEAALNQFEPRGDASVEEYADPADAAVRHMLVTIEEDEDGG